jgi:hypothetical protein
VGRWAKLLLCRSGNARSGRPNIDLLGSPPVSAALIGVIGIIIGTFFGGVVSFYIARRQQVGRAVIAGSLIFGELELAEIRLSATVQTAQWWVSPLPDEMWNRYSRDLLGELDDDSTSKLGGAYSLISGMNGMKAAGSALDSAALQKNIDPINQAKTVLETWRGEQKTRRDNRQRVRRFLILPSASVVVIIIVAVAAIALFAGRPYDNQTTVASAIQSQLGSDAFVDCVPKSSEWLCAVHNLSATRGSCLAGRDPSSIGPINVGRINLFGYVSVTSCHDTENTFALDAVARDGEIVAAPTAIEVEQEMIRKKRFPEPLPVVVAPEPRHTEFVTLLKSLFGKQ